MHDDVVKTWENIPDLLSRAFYIFFFKLKKNCLYKKGKCLENWKKV